MRQQIDEAITFFENEIKQYTIMLKGDLRLEYRTYVENLISYYTIAIHALNEMLE